MVVKNLWLWYCDGSRLLEPPTEVTDQSQCYGLTPGKDKKELTCLLTRCR